MSTITRPAATVQEMPTFSASSAMALMWTKTAEQLSPDELEWFARGAAQNTSDATHSLSSVLMDIGCLILADEAATGSFLEAPSASNLMFNLSHQLSAINGLADIAIDAGHRARLAGGHAA